MLVYFLQNSAVLSEEQNLAAVLGGGNYPRSFRDLACEDEVAIQREHYLSNTSEGVNSGLIVIPDSDHRNTNCVVEVESDSVGGALRTEWREPHMHVILRQIVPIYYFVDCAWIAAISRKHVDIRRNRLYLFLWLLYDNSLAELVKQLDPIKPNIVRVPPGTYNSHL